jgi:hypothetical protein
MSMVDKDSCESSMKVELQTPITLFYSDNVPHLVFEWVLGNHGVTVYYKKDYTTMGLREQDDWVTEAQVYEYFTFDFDIDKVPIKRVQKIIEDHIKEVYLQ